MNGHPTCFGPRIGGKETMKVFVVDDSAEVRKRLITLLSEIQGIESPGQAKDALEATILIREFKPDAVILDICMPGISGVEVLQNIKKNGKGPVVIMLTNYSYPQYRKKCLEAGAEFFFDKSNEFHRVTEVLEQLVQKSKFS
jgi:CheY-like chemotaxis protein